MKLEEFRALTENEKVTLVNNRLAELKAKELSTKEFKSEELNFSYATATKEMHELGYAREKDAFEKEVKLTENEIKLLKNLAYNYEFAMKRTEYQPRVIRRTDDSVSTTSVRMYSQVWKRWQEFSKEWSIYNSIDLMASALEEFMDKHHFEDYETLVKQGKVKDDTKK